MADLKISQLPTASAPLVGTEVLPIVQAGVTDKVTVDNLLARLTNAPPAIGTTTPAAGKFTSLTSTGNTVLGDATTDTLNVGGSGLVKDSAGNVGIGASPTLATLLIGGNLTGGTSWGQVRAQRTIQSDITSLSWGYQALLLTAAASFTLTNYRYYSAEQVTIGAGSAVTSQYGYYADSTLTGAANNYGMYSNISAAANRWNFFANGTANNAFNGNTSLGKVTAPTSATDTTSFGTNLVTNAAGTYTVLTTDHTIIQTTAGSTYTLPTASSFTGRRLHLVTQFAGAVISASSNVVPIAGGAAGTAILAATAGKFAILQSNGTNWVVVAAN